MRRTIRTQDEKEGAYKHTQIHEHKHTNTHTHLETPGEGTVVLSLRRELVRRLDPHNSLRREMRSLRREFRSLRRELWSLRREL